MAWNAQSGSDELASDDMDGWDIALLAVAGYVAVTALVRLMLRRRDDQMVEQLRRQAAQRAEARRRENRRREADERQEAA